MVVSICNPSTVEVSAGQPSLVRELQVSVRDPASRSKVNGSFGIMPEVDL